MNTAWKTVGLFAVALALAGCGTPGPKLYKAGGTVTYKDKAVEGASVTYLYDDGNFATGTTDAAGKFSVLYMGKPGGTVPGKVKVTVIKSASTSSLPASTEGMTQKEKMEQAMKGTVKDLRSSAAQPQSEIPTKYSIPGTSGLQTEVKPDNNNDYPIKLED